VHPVRPAWRRCAGQLAGGETAGLILQPPAKCCRLGRQWIFDGCDLREANSSLTVGDQWLLCFGHCCCCSFYCTQALESSLAEAFDANRQAHTISITSTLPSGGDVGDVWSAMQLAGSISKHLQSVAGEACSGLPQQLQVFIIKELSKQGSCCAELSFSGADASNCVYVD
jgi:hypothetical protein